MIGRRVVVTGLGAVTPLGVGVESVWQRLLAGHCGIRAWTPPPSPNIASHLRESLAVHIAAQVPRKSKSEEEESKSESPLSSPEQENETLLEEMRPFEEKDWLEPGDDRRMSVFIQYAVAAAQQALQHAQWTRANTSDEDRLRTGVCIGSGIGSIQDTVDNQVASMESAQQGYRRVNPFFVPRLLINMAAGHVCMRHGFQGPNHAVATACTAGAHSIGDAMRFIQFGDADVMVAGGAEAAVCPIAIAGFHRAKALATKFNACPREASRPFDRDRDGFVVGEGAGMLVLEELEHAKKRGVKIYAELSGYGVSADAHHITAPPEDGRGAILSMQRALKNARLDPGQVHYINAHATSTKMGDMSELAAIRAVFHRESEPSSLCISSTKGATGHLLGAAGAVEAIFTILAVQRNMAPPTLNLHRPEQPDATFPLNLVPLTAQERPIRVGLTNSFGFGGTNATLVFQKYSG